MMQMASQAPATKALSSHSAELNGAVFWLRGLPCTMTPFTAWIAPEADRFVALQPFQSASVNCF